MKSENKSKVKIEKEFPINYMLGEIDHFIEKCEKETEIDIEYSDDGKLYIYETEIDISDYKTILKVVKEYGPKLGFYLGIICSCIENVRLLRSSPYWGCEDECYWLPESMTDGYDYEADKPLSYVVIHYQYDMFLNTYKYIQHVKCDSLVEAKRESQKHKMNQIVIDNKAVSLGYSSIFKKGQKEILKRYWEQ